MNNLFKYATKELATDAFLAWLFTEFKDNEKLKSQASYFFRKLLLLPANEDSQITDIKVELQKNKIDLLLIIITNQKEYKVLFENKTRTTIHSNQLNKNKENQPDCWQYIYLKLSYIFFDEKKQAEEAGYKVLSGNDLLEAIEPLKSAHQFIEHYYYFLKTEYTDFNKSLNEKFYHHNKFDLFKYREAQQMFISDLHESLYGLDNLKFLSESNNGGSPWTQLYFCKRLKAYGDADEIIFWRLDKKANENYYVRLNQYCEQVAPQYIENKKEVLSKLRKIASDLANKYPDLICGEVTDRGVYESEIIIFFFNEKNKKINEIQTLKNILPYFSKEFQKAYYEYFLKTNE